MQPMHPIVNRARVRSIELALRLHREHEEKPDPEAIIATASRFCDFLLSEENALSPKAADADFA